MAKVRLVDIAAQVGVSTVTVHNALTGQKGVSDELRAVIQKMASEMGYRPVSAARRQERNRMLRSIGVLIHEQYLAEYTTFYWKMYQELALVATDKNCMAAVEILKHDMEDHQILPRMVEENQVEGLIVMGEISREYIRFMKEQTRIPIIFLDFYDKELAEDAVRALEQYGACIHDCPDPELSYTCWFENLGVTLWRDQIYHPKRMKDDAYAADFRAMPRENQQDVLRFWHFQSVAAESKVYQTLCGALGIPRA